MNIYAYSKQLPIRSDIQFSYLKTFDDAQRFCQAVLEEPPLYLLIDAGCAWAEDLHALASAQAVPVVWISETITPEMYPVIGILKPFAFLTPDALNASPQEVLLRFAAEARSIRLCMLSSFFLASLEGRSAPETAAGISSLASILSLKGLYVICICPSAALSGRHREAVAALKQSDESILFSCPRHEDLILLCTNPREETCRRLLSDLEAVDPDQEYGIGISQRLSDPFDFQRGCLEAKRATELNFYKPSQLVWYSDQLFSDRHDYKALVTWEKSLTNAILSGFTEEELIGIIDGYIAYFESSRLLPSMVCESVYHYLNSLDRVFKYIDPMCSIDLSFITPEQIAEYGTLEHLQKALHEMLVDFLRRGEHYNKSGDRLLAEICEYLDEHLGEELSLSVIEERFYVNKFVFCRQFKKYTGLTFNEYLRAHRLNKARELLEKTNIRVYELASQLGFKDESYFSIVFKKEFGLSPSAWRSSRGAAGQNPH